MWIVVFGFRAFRELRNYLLRVLFWIYNYKIYAFTKSIFLHNESTLAFIHGAHRYERSLSAVVTIKKPPVLAVNL